MQDHPRRALLSPSPRLQGPAPGRRIGRRIPVALGVLCAMLTLARGSFAQTTDAAVEAKLHYEEGTKAYSLADFPRAITEFKAAYNAKPEPTLLFNIAQSYRLAGDVSQALFFYRSYLRNKPDALNRRDVDRRIKELEKQVADAKAGVVAAPATGAAGASSAAPATAPVAGVPAPAPATAPSTVPPSAQAVAPAPVQPLPSAAPPVQPPPMGATSTMPPAVQPTTATAVAVAPAGAAPAEESSPFYTRWWFWTGVGAVALVTIAAAASQKQSVPHDDFGGPFSVKY